MRETGGNYTYFSISLYSFSYGITDERKPRFKIQLILDTKNLNEMASPAYIYMTDMEGERSRKNE